MTRLLNQLKRDGLLVEQVSARERRAHELYLTDKGRAVVDALRPVAQSQSAEFFSVLSPEEQSQLLALLKTVYDHAVEIKSQTAGALMKSVAMISGASRGIGATIAQDLLDSGWLLSLGVRDPGRIPPALSGSKHARG